MIDGVGFRATVRKTSFIIPRFPDSDMQNSQLDLFAPLTGYPREARERLRPAASDVKRSHNSLRQRGRVRRGSG